MVRPGLVFTLVVAGLLVFDRAEVVGQAVPDETGVETAPEPVAGEEAKPKDAPLKELSPDEEYELQKALVDALDQIERNYVKPISRRELVEAAIEGVLRKLDPYSTYISPDELDLFRTSVESEFGGIGIQVTMDGGRLTVLSPLVDTPAYEAGILAGDVILEIDGQPTNDLDMDEAIRKLKGQAGSKVVLAVLHPGQDEPKKITIERRQIHVETVLGDRRRPDNSWDFMFDPDKRIGYVRVTAFSRQTAGELRKALESLAKQKMAGLVLDLRFNPGGLLNSGIEVSDLFLSSGRIVSTSGRNTVERSWDAHKEDTFEGFPVVVLVNRYTASAAEIVSACLQDHKRAVVMGERTWGKGSVQNVVALENGHSALKLTTAAYRRPSGKNIHRFPDAEDDDEWGVTPDKGYQLDLSDIELVALLRERRERDVIAAKLVAPKPGATDSSPRADAPPKPAESPRAQPDRKKPVVADRLLKMAVDYLDHELARAK